MVRGEPHIILTLDTKAPIKLDAFIGAFTALANEYERYIKKERPDLEGSAQLHVQEVRPGSYIVDLLPWVAAAAPFINDMDQVMVVEQFVRLWGRRFKAILSERAKTPATPATRSELADWSNAVAAIAQDQNGTSKLEAAVYEDHKKKVRAVFKFDTKQARQAERQIEKKQRRLEKREHVDHSRALMRFTRSDVTDVNIGKPSGERVVIEEISDRPLALIYASELAEHRIKHEIREADDNVYKKGFVVDVNVRTSGGRPVAYAITNVHQVLELAD